METIRTKLELDEIHDLKFKNLIENFLELIVVLEDQEVSFEVNSMTSVIVKLCDNLDLDEDNENELKFLTKFVDMFKNY